MQGHNRHIALGKAATMQSTPGKWIGLALMVGLLSLATGAQAQVGPTNLIGGPGGGSFTSPCRDNEFLTGLTGVGGKDMNSVNAICQPFDAEGRWVGPSRGLRIFGDPNVSYRSAKTHSAECPLDTAAEQIVVQIGANIVHSAALICRHVNAHDYVGTYYAGSHDGNARPEDTTGCGGGALAVGIVLRSGSMIDALGLLCKVTAAPAPSPTPTPTPTPTPAPKPTKPKEAPNNAPLKVDNGDGDTDGNDDAPGNGGGGGATAATDTTIYDQPEGNDVAYLSAGDPVSIVSCDDNNWCKISKPKKGWVWGDDLSR